MVSLTLLEQQHNIQNDTKKKKSQIILCRRGYRSNIFCCFRTRTLSIATGLIMWSEVWGRVFDLITDTMLFFSS